MVTYVQKNTNKHKLNVFAQKSGLFNDINNKKSISAIKSIYKNNYNLHLSACWHRIEMSITRRF